MTPKFPQARTMPPAFGKQVGIPGSEAAEREPASDPDRATESRETMHMRQRATARQLRAPRA